MNSTTGDKSIMIQVKWFLAYYNYFIISCDIRHMNITVQEKIQYLLDKIITWEVIDFI